MGYSKINMSVETFAQLSALNVETVEAMLEGKPIFFDYAHYCLYQNFDEQYNIILSHLKENQIVSKPSDELFTITNKNTIIEVKGKNIPSILLFKKPNWKHILDREPYYVDNFKLMVLLDDDRKIFLGEQSTLLRLSEQFHNKYDIMNVEHMLGRINDTQKRSLEI
jgi:hypothetical protein